MRGVAVLISAIHSSPPISSSESTRILFIRLNGQSHNEVRMSTFHAWQRGLVGCSTTARLFMSASSHQHLRHFARRGEQENLRTGKQADGVWKAMVELKLAGQLLL